jgi:hypothetical protein
MYNYQYKLLNTECIIRLPGFISADGPDNRPASSSCFRYCINSERDAVTIGVLNDVPDLQSHLEKVKLWVFVR